MQKALSTTGHNIANVGTEGYSRQTINFESREAGAGSGGFVGNGVRSASIDRQYDQFLGKELRDNTSAATHFETLSLMSGKLDDLLATCYRVTLYLKTDHTAGRLMQSAHHYRQSRPSLPQPRETQN